MKKTLLILLCLPTIIFGQITYVPDDNFEDFLELNGMGDGISNNDYVLTTNIMSVTFLDVNDDEKVSKKEFISGANKQPRSRRMTKFGSSEDERLVAEKIFLIF